jgi:hypothetical protein
MGPELTEKSSYDGKDDEPRPWVHLEETVVKTHDCDERHWDRGYRGVLLSL